MKAKELTIEEKAKAYDKKLAEAKEMLIDGGISQNTIDCIQKLYPELKCSTDSEDERIINNIRKVIRWYRGIFTEKSLMPEQYQEINAWLEKQGNIDRHIKLPTFTFDDVLALQCCMETVKKVQEDKELYSQLQSLHSRLYDAYWLEKQGEQKPAEWSKEDERNFDIIYGIIYNSCIAEDASRLIEWLKSLKDRVQSQPSQEWSEEDRIARNALIKLVEMLYDSSVYKSDKNRLLDWLKSLRPQSIWKPSKRQKGVTLVCRTSWWC